MPDKEVIQFKGFKKRPKLNATSTINSDGGTIKTFIQGEMTDLTNNFKSSVKNEIQAQEKMALRDEYNNIDSEKDGLYYAKKNAVIS